MVFLIMPFIVHYDVRTLPVGRYVCFLGEGECGGGCAIVEYNFADVQNTGKKCIGKSNLS